MTGGPDLELQGVSVQFGGLKAVNDVSLRGPSGAITGLIGPNGAGKSTTFNACAGTVAARGTITLGGRRLDGLPGPRRARAGLGRTFQRMELVDSASVTDNVAFGIESLAAGRWPWGQLMGSRRARRHFLELAEMEIERCGLSALRKVACADLSTGQRRLVELARVLVAGYPFLLLDEPSSGLDKTETEIFGQIVADAVADTRVGVLLVEHDMALIRQLCSYIYVLDFGELIYQGQADDVLSADVVKRAYLGTEASEAA
jgi:ABC-type branched-subunit amino acid transport system ATPase component